MEVWRELSGESAFLTSGSRACDSCGWGGQFSSSGDARRAEERSCERRLGVNLPFFLATAGLTLLALLTLGPLTLPIGLLNELPSQFSSVPRHLALGLILTNGERGCKTGIRREV